MKSFIIGLWRVKIIWFFLRALYVLKNPISHLRRRKRFNRTKPVDPSIKSHLLNLQKNGYSLESSTALDDSLKQEVMNYSIELRDKLEKFNPSSGDSGKNYLRSIVKNGDLDSDSPLVKFALQGYILELAKRYLGQSAYLHYVDVFETRGVNQGDWREAQLWHRDYPNTRMLKVFVYLNDVEEPGDGPFGILTGQPSHLFSEPTFRMNLKPFRVDDNKIKDNYSKSVKLIFGKKGSVFYADTGKNLHFGSRLADGRSRLVYVATFSCHYTFPFSRNQIKLKGPLGELQSQAVLK